MLAGKTVIYVRHTAYAATTTAVGWSVRGPREPPRVKEVPEGQGSQRGLRESQRAKGAPEGQRSPRTVICN